MLEERIREVGSWQAQMPYQHAPGLIHPQSLLHGGVQAPMQAPMQPPMPAPMQSNVQQCCLFRGWGLVSQYPGVLRQYSSIRVFSAGQTLEGSFSAVSTPVFASKYSFFQVFRDLQDSQTFAPLRTQHFRKKYCVATFSSYFYRNVSRFCI